MSGSKLDSDEAVMAKFGVRADQIVDLPGVDGRQRRQHPRHRNAGRRPRRSGWPNTARWMA
jgi:hypothetical protein